MISLPGGGFSRPHERTKHEGASSIDGRSTSPPNVVVAVRAHNDPRRHATMSIVASRSAAAAAAASARPARARTDAASSPASVASRADRTAKSGRRVHTRALWRDEDAASDTTVSAGGDSGTADRRSSRVGANARGVTSALALAASAAVLAPVGLADLLRTDTDVFAIAAENSTRVSRSRDGLSFVFIASARADVGTSPLPSVEIPAALDPWKDGRARKAAERRAAAESVDAAFRREAQKRAENERLSTAYYAKAAAIRRAKTAAERDGLSGPEAEAVATEAGRKAFERAVTQLSDEEYELARYEERQKALRETAEARNADALAAAKAADEEAARLAAAEAEMESLRKECVGADSPLVEPGSVLCT